MMQRFSDRLLNNLRSNVRNPIIVLQTPALDFLIGSDTILKVARYGDEGLVYGLEGLVYGGLYPLSDDKQKTMISLEDFTKSIRQTLDIDKARGSSISSFSLVLNDKNQEATKIVTGFYGTDLMYQDFKIWIGFSKNSDFNADYLMLFRGVLESVDFRQGSVKLNFASPDIKRRQAIALKGDTELTNNISNVSTSILVDAVDQFIEVPDHPAYGGQDPALKTYIKINDEFIQYQTIVGNIFSGCTRGQLGSAAAAHSMDDQVESFYVLEGRALELALKIMLSDKDQTPYIENLEATAVNQYLNDVIPNIIYFGGVNLYREYNVQIGDFIQTSGFVNPANNLAAWTEILDVVVEDEGSYIVVDSTLVFDDDPTGSVTFLSKYNTLGMFGLSMKPDEVDIKRFLDLQTNFLLESNMRIFIRDEIDEGKEFIEQELFLPLSCYSLPNDKDGLARMSVGVHIQPLPIEQIQEINLSNVVNPDKITVKRNVNRYHYNAIGFKYQDAPDDEVFRRRYFSVVGTQTIPTGNKALIIESKGLKQDLGASQVASRSASRLLQRYRSAAEYMEGVQILFGVGVLINIGDIVIFNPENMNVVDRTNFNRSRTPLLMEVVNKTTDPFDGKVTVDLLDTSFDINARYGVISPASYVSKVLSPNKIIIKKSFGGILYGNNEYRKWEQWLGTAVTIRSKDFTDYFETTLFNISNNTIELGDDVPFVVQENYIMELAPYSNVNTLDKVKLIFGYATDDVNDFPDGKPYYQIS